MMKLASIGIELVREPGFRHEDGTYRERGLIENREMLNGSRKATRMPSDDYRFVRSQLETNECPAKSGRGLFPGFS